MDKKTEKEIIDYIRTSDDKEKIRALLYYFEQTPDICAEAIKKNPMFIGLVKDQTPELCMLAVTTEIKPSGFNIFPLAYIENQTPELCIAAIKNCSFSFFHVKEQTPEICIAAVEEDGFLLIDVFDQTLEVCLAAAKSDIANIEYIRDPEMRERVRNMLKPDISMLIKSAESRVENESAKSKQEHMKLEKNNITR